MILAIILCERAPQAPFSLGVVSRRTCVCFSNFPLPQIRHPERTGPQAPFSLGVVSRKPALSEAEGDLHLLFQFSPPINPSSLRTGPKRLSAWGGESKACPEPSRRGSAFVPLRNSSDTPRAPIHQARRGSATGHDLAARGKMHSEPCPTTGRDFTRAKRPPKPMF